MFVTNPFWENIINFIEYVFEKSSVTCYSDLFGMPLWYNDILRLQLNRQWYENGVLLVGDILDDEAEMLDLEYLQSSLGLKINFIWGAES